MVAFAVYYSQDKWLEKASPKYHFRGVYQNHSIEALKTNHKLFVKNHFSSQTTTTLSIKLTLALITCQKVSAFNRKNEHWPCHMLTLVSQSRVSTVIGQTECRHHQTMLDILTLMDAQPV